MKVVICTTDSTKVLKASLSLDPGQLTALRPHLDHLAAIAIEVNDSVHDWTVLAESLSACCSVVSGLLAFITLHSNKRLMFEDSVGPGTYIDNTVKSRAVDRSTI